MPTENETRKQRGRPPRITGKELAEIVRRIACEKMSVPSACEGICSSAAFWVRLSKSPELQGEYARAREVRGDVRAESMDGVLGALNAGKIDAAAARVMIDTIKWQCAHEKPKRYGDAQQVKLTGEDGGAVLVKRLIGVNLDEI